MKKTLKSIAVMLCAVLTIGLASCTKDNEDLIIGKWDVVSVTETISGHPDAEMNGTHTENFTGAYSMSITFNKDKTGIMTDSDGHTVDNNNFTYTVDGDVLYLTSEGFTTRLTIDKLNKKEMTITASEEMEEEYMDDNYEMQVVTYSWTESINLKKV